MARKSSPIGKLLSNPAERAARQAARARGRAKRDVEENGGPSPNPATNLLLADLVMRGGGALLRHAVERGLLSKRYSAGKAGKIVKGRTMGQTLVTTALARVATRSVPGALLVGGSLLAKTLYERRQGRKAKAEGEKDLNQQAAKAD